MSAIEIIDIVIKVVSGVAIAVPIWLFFLQQKREVERQKGQMQIDLYTNAAVDLNYIFEKDSYADFLETRKEKVLYEYGTKIKLFFPKVVSIKYDAIKLNIELYISLLSIEKVQVSVDEVYLRLLQNIFPYDFYDKSILVGFPELRKRLRMKLLDVRQLLERIKNLIDKAKRSNAAENSASNYNALITYIDIFLQYENVFQEKVDQAVDGLEKLPEDYRVNKDHIETSKFIQLLYTAVGERNVLKDPENELQKAIKEFQGRMLAEIAALDENVIQNNILFKNR